MSIFRNILLASFIFFIGCSDHTSFFENWMEENGKKKVLTTTSMIGDIVHYIGKEKVDTLTLIHSEIDPHSYELIKGDDEKLARADLIFYNGLGLEHGASLAYYLTSSDKAFSLGEAVKEKFPKKIIYTREGTIDPHIWMDVEIWSYTIDDVVEQLSKLDPEGTEEFIKNGNHLKKEMHTLHSEIKNKFKQIPSENRYLVTSHDAFQYFAKSYLADEGEEENKWKKRVSAPEGLAPEGEISPKDIKKVIDFLHQNEVAVIFPESNVAKYSLEKIVTDAHKMGLMIKIAQSPLYGDTMPKQKEGLSYLNMLRHNAKVIAENIGD